MHRLGCFLTFRLWAPKSPKRQDSFWSQLVASGHWRLAHDDFGYGCCRSHEFGKNSQEPRSSYFVVCPTRKTAFVSWIRSGLDGWSECYGLQDFSDWWKCMLVALKCQKWLLRILSSRCHVADAETLSIVDEESTLANSRKRLVDDVKRRASTELVADSVCQDVQDTSVLSPWKTGAPLVSK